MPSPHQQPSVESVPELVDGSLGSAAGEASKATTQEEGTDIRDPRRNLRDEREHDSKPLALGTEFDRRKEAKRETGLGPNKPNAPWLPHPRSERLLRRPMIPRQKQPEPRECSNSHTLEDEGGERGSKDEIEDEPEEHGASPALFNPATLSLLAATASRSGSSSGSGSTVTPASYTRTGKVGDVSGSQPNALSYLDRDSPAVTEESIQRSVAEAVAHWREPDAPASPQSAASSSSTSSTSPDSLRSDGASEEGTDPSTSPEQSENGDIVSTTFTQVFSGPPDCASPFHIPKLSVNNRAPQRRQQYSWPQLRAEARAHRYGTPEMPRGRANLPHLPPSALTPRVSNPGHGHAKHLPRAEKLPLTGYELLAAELSSHPNTRQSRNRRRTGTHFSSRGVDGHQFPARVGTSIAGELPDKPVLKPIYRRFEALNHRLLLHLQDELSELEEHLHRLDTADTQTRRLQNCILPASRRSEHMAGGELQWHKTDILGKIGFKLGQYNHVLSSFTATQCLPAPDMSDVQTYRDYLETRNPITEIETRFLDPAEDLVSLAPSARRPVRSPISTVSDADSGADYFFPASDDILTPIPRRAIHHHHHRPNTASTSTFLPATTPANLGLAEDREESSARLRTVTREREALPTTLAEQQEATAVGSSAQRDPTTVRIMQIVAAVAVAVEIPVLTSRALDDAAACVAVALVAATTVGWGHFAGLLGAGGSGTALAGMSWWWWAVCAGAYGVVMAFVLGWVA